MDLIHAQRTGETVPVRLRSREIVAVCRRVLGPMVPAPLRAVELSVGTYNTTYRLDFAARASLILRASPARDDELGGTTRASDMRNGDAAAPFFVAALDELAPRTVGADFTHDLVGRDVVIQERLVGVPASDLLRQWSAAQHRAYYRELGRTVRRVHRVEGHRFGRVIDAIECRWSDALRAELVDLADRMDAAALDGDQMRRAISALDAHRDELDAVRTPRLLHNDLWSLNVLVDPNAAAPRITGVVDLDGASWGDPMADLPIHNVRLRTGNESDEFWTGYGPPDTSDGADTRELFYRARLLAGAHLDIVRRRLDLAAIPSIHWDLSPVLAALRA